MTMPDNASFTGDFEELIRRLPKPVLLRDTKTFSATQSCFVNILGFEPRCYASADYFAQKGWIVANTICIHYTEKMMKGLNEQHAKKMLLTLTTINSGKDPVVLEHNDHDLTYDFGERLLNKIAASGFDPNSSNTHIIFDITVGSSRLLTEGLHALLKSNVKLTLLYSEATDYRPTFREYMEYLGNTRAKQIQAPEFLASGVESIELVKRIPGYIADSRPTCIVLFPSFNPTRVGSVLEELSPSRVYWIFGVPHLVKNRWRIDAQRDFHSTWAEPFHRHCYVSTFDYTESLYVLEMLYRRYADNYNIMICSLGSKLQKVGQILFHVLRPEVAAVVSIPKRWDPVRYSDDRPRAIYRLDLGSCPALEQKLSSTRLLKL